MRALRIAFVDYVCDPAKPGRTGLSDLVWDVAARLARLGDEVHVVAPYTAATPDPAVRVHRFALPPLGYRNVFGHALIVGRAVRALRALGSFDVVHVPEYLSAAVLPWALPETPVVLTEPGNVYERVAHGNPYDPVTTVAYKLAARLAARRCARLIATSDEMARWWRATGFDAERVVRIPLGIDARLFRRIPDAQARIGVTDGTRTIVFAARLSRENGADVALEAFARMRARRDDVRLHVLGDGPERVTLAALSRRLGVDGAVVWHGWVDYRDLPRYYSAADAFVFSGCSGGTPRVLLQAMACGAPVVASRIGGIVDHVRHGHNGLLIPSKSPAAFVDTLLDLMDHPEEGRRLGGEAARYARAAVDWDVLVRRIREEVYGPIVGMGRPGARARGDHAAPPTGVAAQLAGAAHARERFAIPGCDAHVPQAHGGTGAQASAHQ